MDSTFIPFAERPLQMRIKEVRLLLMDVEGALTDADADPIEPDHSDLDALKRWQEAGGRVVMLVRADYPPAKDLCLAHGLDFQAHHGDKDQVVRTVIVGSGAKPDDACYLGATKEDLPAMICTGITAAVATDDPWVSGGALINLESAGGSGAVAELVGRLMDDGAPRQS